MTKRRALQKISRRGAVHTLSFACRFFRDYLPTMLGFTTMFITFEGIDGCGKSTQANLLENRLRASFAGDIIAVRDPGNTGVSESIRGLLLDKAHAAMTPRTELLLFSAARAQLVDAVIAPTLKKGGIVISDRFTDSTIAYQAFGRGLPLEDIRAANLVATGGVAPEVTFYLDISLAAAKSRCSARSADRMELAGDAFFERVIAGYRSLAEREPSRVKSLDGERSAGALHEIVWAEIAPRLSELSASSLRAQ
jgi:dTMP kinase